MSTLSNLTLIALPDVDRRSPTLRRRSKLVAQLQHQRSLALDAQYVVSRQKWVTTEGGSKQLVSSPKRLKRWWTEDTDGKCILIVRYGSKPLALAAGKHAVDVGTKAKLVEVIDLIIVAAKAGELDEQIAATQKVGQKPVAKTK